MPYAKLTSIGQRLKFTAPGETKARSLPLNAISDWKIENAKLIFTLSPESRTYQILLTALLIGDAEAPITDEAEAEAAMDALFPDAGTGSGGALLLE